MNYVNCIHDPFEPQIPAFESRNVSSDCGDDDDDLAKDIRSLIINNILKIILVIS